VEPPKRAELTARFDSTNIPPPGQRERSKEVPDSAVGRRPRTSGTGSAAEEWGAGYAVYDPVGQKIDSAEEVFVYLDGEPMYIRVRLGFLFTSTVLIPVQFVETDDEDKTLILK
jgi:hypothetical protein